MPHVRDVLVVLLWLWLLVSLSVYGYRLWRRATKGPRARRDAPAETSGEPRSDRSSRGAPPLPDGPAEARLPRSLQGQALPSDPGLVPAPPPTQAGGAPPTVAEALQGIRMPDHLLPVVDPDVPGFSDGQRARFSGTGTSVPAVAAGLGDELRRLGYLVDGLDTVSSSRAGLSARRAGTTVSASIDLDEDGAVTVELRV